MKTKTLIILFIVIVMFSFNVNAWCLLGIGTTCDDEPLKENLENAPTIIDSNIDEWEFTIRELHELYPENLRQINETHYAYTPISYNNSKVDELNYEWKIKVNYTDSKLGKQEYLFKTNQLKKDLGKEVIMTFPINVTHFTFTIGENSSVIDASSDSAASRPPSSDNICMDSTGRIHTAYEGGASDLWYGFSDDNGLNWTIKEILSGTVEHVGVVCKPNDDVVVFFNNGANGWLEGYNSTNGGVEFNTKFTMSDNGAGFPSCVSSTTNILHCCFIEEGGDSNMYINSTEWLNEIVVEANDGDYCDIAMNKTIPYIINSDNSDDILEIYSPELDGWGDANGVVILDMGQVVAIGDDISLSINKQGTMWVTAIGSGSDMWVFNSSLTHPRSWTSNEVETAGDHARTDIISNSQTVQLLFTNDPAVTTASSVKIMESNDSINWGTSRNINTNNVGHPSLMSNGVARWQQLEDELRFVHSGTFTDLVFFNLTVPFNQSFPLNSALTNLTRIDRNVQSVTHLNIIDPDLIMYVPFDPTITKNTAEDWANGFRGTIQGATHFVNTGFYGGGFKFDGVSTAPTDEIIYGPETKFNSVENESTFIIWAKLDQTATGKTNGLFKIVFSSTDKINFEIGAFNNLIASQNDINNAGNNTFWLGAGNICRPDFTDSWTMFTMIMNSTHWGAYMNGSLCGVTTISGENYLSNLDDGFTVNIGEGNFGSQMFNGTLDEFSWYNRTLSASEVSQHYLETKARFEPLGEQIINDTIVIGNNRINLTINHENQPRTNVSVSIQHAGGTTARQNLSSGVPSTFTVSDSTTSFNISIEYYNPKGFFTPIVYDNMTFSVFSGGAADETPPTITNLRNTTTTNQSSFIEWTCNENCNYTIRWYNLTGRTAAALIGTIANTTSQTTHNPYLPNLLNSTTYFINLTVSDSSGNSAKNNTFSFTTAPNVAGGVDLCTCANLKTNNGVGCDENCTITSDCDMDGNNLLIAGIGMFTVNNARLHNYGIGKVSGGCQVKLFNGGMII